jgi:hypothetical protein
MAQASDSSLVRHISLKRLGLSVRASNCLRVQKISTVAQLIDLRADTILSWQNAGKKTLEELRQVLARLGLNLAGELPQPERQDHRFVAEIVSAEAAQSEKDKDERPTALHAVSDPLQRALVTPVDLLHLSVRAEHGIKALKVKYLGELAQLRLQDIVAVRSIGRKTAREIERALREFGLRFGIEVTDWSRERASDLYQQFKEEIEGKQCKKDESLLNSFGPQPVCLEDELLRIAKALEPGGRNARLLLDFWGWGGQGSRTLESVGQQYKLTRERVRQIQARALKRLASRSFPVPFATKAIGVLGAAVPDVESALSQTVAEAGVSRAHFHPSGLEIAAHHLGLRWPFASVAIGSDKALTYANDAEALSKSHQLLRRRTSEQGCANITALAAELGIEGTKTNGLSRILNIDGHTVWLDSDKEWLYTTSSARNRLYNLCGKIFGVTEKVHLSELRRAVSKSRRLAMCPPQGILAAFIERCGLSHVENGIAIAVPGAGIPPAPGSAEACMVRVLNTYGPVMDGEDFAEKCIAEGLNATTVYIYRLISPLISSLGRNVFCRVGAEVPPGSVESVIAGRRTTPLAYDHGWTVKGNLWFGLELSRQQLVAGGFRLNTFVRDFVQGEWEVLLPNGTSFETVTAREMFIWSFRKQLKLLGAEPGDLATFEFNLKNESVMLRVGGPELFEVMQASQPGVADGDATEEDDAE